MLAHNDEYVQAINQAAVAHPEQQLQALKDADRLGGNAETAAPGFGPILGQYFAQGITDGSLTLINALMEDTRKGSSTSPAKQYFSYPRPFLNRETWSRDGGTTAHNELGSLKPTLNIYQVPDQKDDQGRTRTAKYATTTGGAFPSGHTTSDYSRETPLAVILPELAPEILARASEEGNNRIVLGVHYPLDIIGGRISGYTLTADYLAKNRDKFNAGKGHANNFVDVVSTKPVSDRKSRLDAFTARMSYGFAAVGERGQAFSAPDGTPR